MIDVRFVDFKVKVIRKFAESEYLRKGGSITLTTC